MATENSDKPINGPLKKIKNFSAYSNARRKEILFDAFECNLTEKQAKEFYQISQATYYRYKKMWLESKGLDINPFGRGRKAKGDTNKQIKIDENINQDIESGTEIDVAPKLKMEIDDKEVSFLTNSTSPIEFDPPIEPINQNSLTNNNNLVTEKYAPGDLIYIQYPNKTSGRVNIDHEALVISVNNQEEIVVAVFISHNPNDINSASDIILNPNTTDSKIVAKCGNISVYPFSQIGKIKSLDVQSFLIIKNKLAHLLGLNLASNTTLNIKEINGEHAFYKIENSILTITTLNESDYIKVDIKELLSFITELNDIARIIKLN